MLCAIQWSLVQQYIYSKNQEKIIFMPRIKYDFYKTLLLSENSAKTWKYYKKPNSKSIRTERKIKNLM